MVHIPLTDSMPDLKGRLIDDGRFLLLDTLGSGAYGRVYRALDKNSVQDRKHFVAIKCLYKSDPGSPQAEFQSREFSNHRIVCDHPNIITLHKVVFDKYYTYVVLDFCSGGDLFSAITEKRLFHNNVALVKQTFVQLIDAVEHCHDQGVFHRDIKPENVLCTEDGTHIWLADFGLSTRNQVSRDLGCGSSYYMSPECIGKELTLGRYSTRHSDIWSLGIILTNMISGRNPWRYATTKDDCFSAFLHNKDFLRHVLPISAGANEILKKIFKLNPLCRITLPELRKEILGLDTFFLTGGRTTPLIGSPRANDAGGKTPRPGQKPHRESSCESTSSTDSAESYMFASPRVDQIGDDTIPNEVVPSSSGSGSGTSSSEAESDGPITPATRPVDPGVEVPELSEEDGIGQAAISREPPAGVKVENKKAPARRTQLIRTAFQRLKGISPGGHS